MKLQIIYDSNTSGSLSNAQRVQSEVNEYITSGSISNSVSSSLEQGSSGDFKVILNDAPGSVKSFHTLNYEGSDSRVVMNLLDNQYYNINSRPGWYVDSIITDKESGTLEEFIEKEGKWFNYIKGVDFDLTSPDLAALNVQGLGTISSHTTAN